LSHPKKVFLGFLTHWPIAYMFLFLAVWLAMFFSMTSENPEVIFGLMTFIFPLHALTMLSCMGLRIYYIVHPIRDQSLDDNGRIIWVLVNAMGGMLGWPVYYWMRIHSAPVSVE